jgi:hypothetical protein
MQDGHSSTETQKASTAATATKHAKPWPTEPEQNSNGTVPSFPIVVSTCTRIITAVNKLAFPVLIGPKPLHRIFSVIVLLIVELEGGGTADYLRLLFYIEK